MVEERGAPARAAPRGARAFALRTISWAVIGAAAVLLAVALALPRLAGAHPYTILTGSMRPSLPPGTLVVTRPADPEDVGVGSVITYQLRSGEPAVVTHRVVAQGVDGSGQFVYWTKGDANSAVDAEPVLPVQVRGKLWYSVPYVGYVSQLLSGEQRQLLLDVLIGGLLMYAGSMFAGAVKDRCRASP
jgi:signal peptidase